MSESNKKVNFELNEIVLIKGIRFKITYFNNSKKRITVEYYPYSQKELRERGGEVKPLPPSSKDSIEIITAGKIPMQSNILEEMEKVLKPTVAAKPAYITLCESKKEILGLKNKGKVERVEDWPEQPKEEVKFYEFEIVAWSIEEGPLSKVIIILNANNESTALNKARELIKRERYEVIKINCTT